MDETNVGQDGRLINRLNLFGQEFGGDRIPAGLLSAHRFGVLTTQQLADSMGVGYDYASRHLIKQMLARKLVKSVSVSGHKFEHGRPPAVYALTKSGHDYLCSVVDQQWHVDEPVSLVGDYVATPNHIDWGNGRAHRVALVDCLLAVERAARQLSSVQVLDIIAEHRRWRSHGRPTAMRLESGRRLQSDAVFRLELDGTIWPQAIEIDCGTETISSNDPTRLWATIEGKARMYWQALHDRTLVGQFECNCEAFQVLFITTTDTRIDNMRAAIADAGLIDKGGVVPANVFFFSTIERVQSGFFDPVWIDLAGRACSITPGAST